LYYHTIASLAGFRVFGFVGACGVVLSINKSSLASVFKLVFSLSPAFTSLPSPHRPRLVVSRSTCLPISPPPHANSLILGPAVINTHTLLHPEESERGYYHTVMARRRRRRPPGGHTTVAGIVGQRARFSTDTASYTHTDCTLADGTHLVELNVCTSCVFCL
jgi:hypothetical protein